MTDAAIAVEGLAKRFGEVVALAGIDLHVAPGTVFGLLGPNGAGKTTAVRILATILPPDGGSARVLGRDVVREANAVRGLIGLAGQYAAVDENLTGRENLRLIARLSHLPRQLIPRRADELLERFALDGAADRPVRGYSGGMRRRLDVAAALVHRPPVLFLDEPTTGLDPRTRRELWALIGELVGEGTTILLTTQYLEEADRLSNRVAVVDEGRVIAEGTAGELKARLGNSVIELGLASEAEAARAHGLVTRFAAETSAVDGSTVRLDVAGGASVLTAALSALDDARITPVSIVFREPSLDEVFLALTGHEAQPSQPEKDRLVPSGGPR